MTVEIGAVKVYARGISVGRRGIQVALAVGVVRAAVCWSVVAISIRMHVAVSTLTRAGVKRP